MKAQTLQERTLVSRTELPFSFSKEVQVRLPSNRVCALSVIAALLFVSGVAVGQGAGGRWKKYLVRSEATQLDWNFLSMQLRDIQNSLSLLEEMNAPFLHGVPAFSINPKTGKIDVLIAVH